ncbi:MAG: hypothetical protein ABR985_21950 [Methanotrichaceae archaeon]|jgi:hypothetical protein
MNDIRLTGLIGSNPLGALAAFGLLRVCSEIPELSEAKLYWTQEYDWTAVLRIPDGIGKPELLEKLVARQSERKLDTFNWAKDIRVKPGDYHKRLVILAEEATLNDRTDADYFTAFGSEMVVDGSKGLVKPTAMHMTSGQQKFLHGVCEIAESLKKNPKSAYEEALFGPWRYNDAEHSLGWDSSMDRVSASHWIKPSDDKKNRSVRAATWLAIEALPLFPTAAMNGKLLTAGFTTKPPTFTYPIWTDPIGIDTLKTLLGICISEDERSLKRRGVAAIYHSLRLEFGKGYGILRPATES